MEELVFEDTLLSRCIMRRMCESIQLEDWTRLGGLTQLSLRDVQPSVACAVLPHLTTLRSLVLVLTHDYDHWPNNDSGEPTPALAIPH